jgi:hypothetical protein
VDVGSSKTLLPLAEMAGVMAKAKSCTAMMKSSMTITGIRESDRSDIGIVMQIYIFLLNILFLAIIIFISLLDARIILQFLRQQLQIRAADRFA